MNPLEERAVAPFRLTMVGLNAPEQARSVWPDLVATGRSLDPDDVRWLLRQRAWRGVAMGAWFATRFDGDEVGPDLRHAMRTCQGSLTAPPLAVACVLVVGAQASEDLRSYLDSPWAGDGHSGVVEGALRHLGHLPGTTPFGGAEFPHLLEVGQRLQSALRRAAPAPLEPIRLEGRAEAGQDRR